MLKKNVSLLIVSLLSFQILAACGSTPKPAAAPTAPSEPTKAPTAATAPPTGSAAPASDSILKEKTKVTQVLDWFAQSTHAGLYAASAKGFYKDSNLDVTIKPGGAQVSAVQIVAAGQAEFGLASADSILIAREQGIPIVGVAAFLQKSPSAIFFHKGDNIKSFSDLNGRTVYAALTAAYWTYLKKSYKLDSVKEVQFTGQYTNFVNDPKALTQGYTTNTPYSLKQQNIDVDALLVADSGYSPYYSIIITSEKYLKEHPDVVKAYVQASVKGWDYYKDNIEEVAKVLNEANKENSVDYLVNEGKLQKDFIYGGDAATKGVGYMSLERWQELSKQLQDIGQLKKNEDVQQAFNTSFLPKK
ncbi:ABC transporter substrate-binding protein [Paenibacillus sp. FSL H8-0034]|uniref:ABC transporter substrate-binding protein n=1 Tax=Paenibacillus sp. FSL H8-0034 TaxID=2954671 RepID=UPI0030FB466C